MKQTFLILFLIFHTVLSIPEQYQGPKPDGSYSFSYDTNTGGFHSQSGSSSGASAKYGFNTGEGNLNVQFSGGGGNGGGGLSAPIPYSAPTGGDNGGTYSLNLMPDGSYSYKYDLKDQGKSENRKTDGEVAGQFYFTAKDGQKKSIQYTAGREGFLPIGDHIPKADPPPSGASYSPYSGLSNGGGGSGVLALSLNPGGDYSYSYKLKDQSKSESGSGGKVKGQFSFVDPDGKNRALSYTADERGFLPEADYLPKPVEPLPLPSAGGGSYSAPAAYSAGAGSYSFDYAALAHDRSEQGSSGDISGKYSVKSTGGDQKSSYTAGKQGFLPIHSIKINLG